MQILKNSKQAKSANKMEQIAETMDENTRKWHLSSEGECQVLADGAGAGADNAYCDEQLERGCMKLSHQ